MLKIQKKEAMYILENDRQLTALFLANMSEGARQQLIAQAKMKVLKQKLTIKHIYKKVF
jgi:hypothetical protein